MAMFEVDYSYDTPKFDTIQVEAENLRRAEDAAIAVLAINQPDVIFFIEEVRAVN